MKMKVPITEKRYITTTEAAEYFSLGIKALRDFAVEHPDLAFFHGNRYLFFREGMEKHLATYGLGKGNPQKQSNQVLDPYEKDDCEFDWNGFFYDE